MNDSLIHEGDRVNVREQIVDVAESMETGRRQRRLLIPVNPDLPRTRVEIGQLRGREGRRASVGHVCVDSSKDAVGDNHNPHCRAKCRSIPGQREATQ